MAKENVFPLLPNIFLIDGVGVVGIVAGLKDDCTYDLLLAAL